MEIIMEDAGQEQYPHQQQHHQQQQSHSLQQQFDGAPAYPYQPQPAAAQDMPQVQPVADHSGHIPQQQAERPAAPPPQAQQQPNGKAGRSSKGSRYKDPKDEGPNVDNWWLSESEGEGDEDDEQRLLTKSEDPLYDPQADEADEAWAVQQRSGRTTDAILSCPGCFTTLCIDCQQHEHYHTQYRAMFTQNCEVKQDEVVQAQVQRPQPQQQQKGRKRRADAAAPQGVGLEEGDVLRPVCCAVCGTQVGAQDADEVVHFYQVLASEC